jgi:hypothetical protein
MLFFATIEKKKMISVKRGNKKGVAQVCMQARRKRNVPMNKFKLKPTSAMPLEMLHISVYSPSVYACTGQGCMQLSTVLSEMGFTNGGGHTVSTIFALSPGTKQATFSVAPSACVYSTEVVG